MVKSFSRNFLWNLKSTKICCLSSSCINPPSYNSWICARGVDRTFDKRLLISNSQYWNTSHHTTICSQVLERENKVIALPWSFHEQTMEILNTYISLMSSIVLQLIRKTSPKRDIIEVREENHNVFVESESKLCLK